MDNIINWWQSLIEQFPFSKTIVLSILIIIGFSILKRFFYLGLVKKNIPKEQKVFLRRKVNGYLNLVLLPILILLWFAHLQVFLVSLVAVAAAIVIAFKEFIMCLVGGLYLKNSKIFKIGDRIEIDNVRGFVIESFIASTKVLEIGPERNSQQTTGEVIGIPNSLFLSHAVKNESYFRGYSIKTFQFSAKVNENLDQLEELLLAEAKAICEDYIDDASASISNFCEREGIVIPSVKPRTKVVLEDHELVRMLVKIAVRNSEIADVEQRLNRLVINWKRKHSA